MHAMFGSSYTIVNISDELNNHYSIMSYDIKGECGMRFKDCSFSLALPAKMAWRLHQNPASLRSKVNKGLYFPHSDFLEATKAAKTS